MSKAKSPTHVNNQIQRSSAMVAVKQRIVSSRARKNNLIFAATFFFLPAAQHTRLIKSLIKAGDKRNKNKKKKPWRKSLFYRLTRTIRQRTAQRWVIMVQWQRTQHSRDSGDNGPPISVKINSIPRRLNGQAAIRPSSTASYRLSSGVLHVQCP